MQEKTDQTSASSYQSQPAKWSYRSKKKKKSPGGNYVTQHVTYSSVEPQTCTKTNSWLHAVQFWSGVERRQKRAAAAVWQSLAADNNTGASLVSTNHSSHKPPQRLGGRASFRPLCRFVIATTHRYGNRCSHALTRTIYSHIYSLYTINAASHHAYFWL